MRARCRDLPIRAGPPRRAMSGRQSRRGNGQRLRTRDNSMSPHTSEGHPQGNGGDWGGGDDAGSHRGCQKDGMPRSGRDMARSARHQPPCSQSDAQDSPAFGTTFRWPQAETHALPALVPALAASRAADAAATRPRLPGPSLATAVHNCILSSRAPRLPSTHRVTHRPRPRLVAVIPRQSRRQSPRATSMSPNDLPLRCLVGPSAGPGQDTGREYSLKPRGSAGPPRRL